MENEADEQVAFHKMTNEIVDILGKYNTQVAVPHVIDSLFQIACILGYQTAPSSEAAEARFKSSLKHAMKFYKEDKHNG